MRSIVALTFLSLDGVMQAPGGKGEDPSGGFDLEGWTVPYFDDAAGKEMARQMGEPFDLLLGKTTYDIFAAHWPKKTDDTAEAFNKATKYVVADEAPAVDWQKTVRISGDVVGEIKKVKQRAGPMLQVYGSSVLLQTLLANDLVDELWLKTFPVTLGKGKRLFGEGTQPAAWKLLEFTTTPSGVILARYKRAGPVKLGSFV